MSKILCIILFAFTVFGISLQASETISLKSTITEGINQSAIVETINLDGVKIVKVFSLDFYNSELDNSKSSSDLFYNKTKATLIFSEIFSIEHYKNKATRKKSYPKYNLRLSYGYPKEIKAPNRKRQVKQSGLSYS